MSKNVVEYKLNRGPRSCIVSFHTRPGPSIFCQALAPTVSRTNSIRRGQVKLSAADGTDERRAARTGGRCPGSGTTNGPCVVQMDHERHEKTDYVCPSRSSSGRRRSPHSRATKWCQCAPTIRHQPPAGEARSRRAKGSTPDENIVAREHSEEQPRTRDRRRGLSR